VHQEEEPDGAGERGGAGAVILRGPVRQPHDLVSVQIASTCSRQPALYCPIGSEM
jgi:hypothetical protein